MVPLKQHGTLCCTTSTGDAVSASLSSSPIQQEIDDTKKRLAEHLHCAVFCVMLHQHICISLFLPLSSCTCPRHAERGREADLYTNTNPTQDMSPTIPRVCLSHFPFLPPFLALSVAVPEARMMGRPSGLRCTLLYDTTRAVRTDRPAPSSTVQNLRPETPAVLGRLPELPAHMQHAHALRRYVLYVSLSHMTGGQREFGKRGETKGRRSCGRKKKRRGG
jgi:hypothetical protein